MPLSREKEKLLQRLKNPRLRRREGLFLVEGIRSAGEFLGAGLSIDVRFALVSPRLETLDGGAQVMARLEESAVPFTEVDDARLSLLSETESPQGILLVAREPAGPGKDRALPGGSPGVRLLLLDGIQDPGNVGTLVRGARAFGLDGVVALDGTADPWGAKAVRASAGALAHVPLFRMSAPDTLAWLEKEDVPLLVAEAGGRDLRQVHPGERWALALGNEGAGTRTPIRAAARDLLSIPMAPGVDSLNVAVAGSIVLFALSASGSGSQAGGGREGEAAGAESPQTGTAEGHLEPPRGYSQDGGKEG